TTDGAAGMVDSANIFANQAKAAGVTVNVHNDPNYYGDAYLKLAFSVDFWGTRNYLPQVANGSIPTAPYNECHWPPKDSNYISLYQQALAETDAGKRADIIHQMQKLEYEQGGYIIPMFNNLVDAYSTKVAGFNQGSKARLFPVIRRARSSAAGRHRQASPHFASSFTSTARSWSSTSPGPSV